MSDKSETNFKVNQRISCGDRRGTVRYIGSLESIGHQGLWAGIEWDEESSSYHNGIVHGHRFFLTGPNRASFLPIHKLNEGVSVQTAILEKYGGSTEEPMEVGVRFGTKNVVAVGWETVMKKVSHLEQLKHVDLTGFHINDSERDLASLIPNVETLALRQSLIATWSSILSMIQNLSSLTTLDLGQNRLVLDTDKTNSCVRRLVLRRNNLSWQDVLGILRLFPALEDIFLSENIISSVDYIPDGLVPRLSKIDLESQICSFSDWNEVNKLGKINMLKALQLSGNHFREIRIPTTDVGAVLFPSMDSLTLKLNQITEWTSVDELSKLPSLENLKLTQNPVLETVTPQTARQWIIAKVGNLRILNQTPITNLERRDSELDYLRHFGSEWLSLNDSCSKESFLRRHPRFLELLQRHGPLEPGEVSQLVPKHLNDSLIQVTLQCENIRKEKSIPPTITVMKLKRLTERTFRIPEISQLAYSTPSIANVKYLLDDDSKEISHYDVKTGDTIIVS